jgi:leader peptidase (prepilin peptidase)/N-methyltransferase
LSPIVLETVAVLLATPFVGSFLGVVIDRLPAGRPVLVARSRCDACGARLGVTDLVPVASWLWQRGRCAHCRAGLSAFYPIIELSALAVALSAAFLLSGWLLPVSCALGWTLLTLAVIDWRHFLLPDALTLPLIPAGLAVAWAIDPALLVPHAVGALAGFAAFAAIAALYRRLRRREGLGLGGAKLLAAAGAQLGWQALPGLVVVAALGALAVALARALTGDRVSATTQIAFGGYLALAFWLVWLLGPPILA